MSSIVDTPYSTLPQPKSGWQLFKSLASGSPRRGWRGKIRPIDVSLCCARWQRRSPLRACSETLQNSPV